MKTIVVEPTLIEQAVQFYNAHPAGMVAGVVMLLAIVCYKTREWL